MRLSSIVFFTIHCQMTKLRQNQYFIKVDQRNPGLSVLLLSSFLPTLFLSSESRMWIDFHWSNINISWRDRERIARLEGLEGKKKKKVERWKWSIHFWPKEKCVAEMNSTVVVFITMPQLGVCQIAQQQLFFCCSFSIHIHIYFYKANKSRVYPLKKSTVKQLQTSLCE